LDGLQVSDFWLLLFTYSRTYPFLLLVFCAVIRMLYVALVLVFGFASWGTTNGKRVRHATAPDLVFVDGVSAPLVLLYLFGYPTMFYCHYPDMVSVLYSIHCNVITGLSVLQLLVQKRGGWLQSFYRRIFDWFEEFSTGHANLILVNSKFTQQRFAECFPNINAYCPATVVYPCLPVDGASKGLRRNRSRGQDDEQENLGIGVDSPKATNVGVKVKRKLRRIGDSDEALHLDLTSVNNTSHDPNSTPRSIDSPRPKLFIHDKFVHCMKPSRSRTSSSSSSYEVSPRDPVSPRSKTPASLLDAFGSWGGEDNTTCSLKGSDYVTDIPYASGADFVFVSLNRFERKKNISLALQAFRLFKENLKTLPGGPNSPRKEDSQIQMVYLRNNYGAGSSPRDDESPNSSRQISPRSAREDADSSKRENSPAPLRLRKGLQRKVEDAPSAPSVDSPGDRENVSPVRGAPPIAVIDSPKTLQIGAARKQDSDFANSSPLIRENDPNIYIGSVSAGHNISTGSNSTAAVRRRSRTGSEGGFVLDFSADDFLSNFNTNLMNARILLVVAGGYEKSVPENVEYLEVEASSFLWISH
jgi:glycosyltransferase involved in cell wall biosynthesis